MQNTSGITAVPCNVTAQYLVHCPAVLSPMACFNQMERSDFANEHFAVFLCYEYIYNLPEGDFRSLKAVDELFINNLKFEKQN